MPLDASSVKIFDQMLEFYYWTEVKNLDLLVQMSDTNNFNKENYKAAVGTYQQWCIELYPKMDANEKLNYKLAFAQQTLSILHAHAPNHKIHRQLSKK